MTLSILNSDDARSNWREVLDSARSGADTVIARYGKPMAAVIPFDDYEALREELEDLRAARRAQALLEAWEADESRARSYAEVRAEMVSEGLLDE